MGAFNYASNVSATEQGFSAGANRRGLWVVAVAVVLSAGMIVAGAIAGTVHPLYGIRTPFWHALGYTVWALGQEWMSLGFVLVRLERMMEGRFAVLGCALIFSLAHVPNTVLMATTFVMCGVFALVFRRYRALYPLTVSHALLGMSLALSVPPPALHFMRVGAAYFR
jgi:membrane protease YdiL (CAAX protease family)